MCRLRSMTVRSMCCLCCLCVGGGGVCLPCNPWCAWCRCTRQYMIVFWSCFCGYSIGKGVEQLLERPDGKYCFRLHEDRVYYVRSVVHAQLGRAALPPPPPPAIESACIGRTCVRLRKDDIEEVAGNRGESCCVLCCWGYLLAARRNYRWRVPYLGTVSSALVCALASSPNLASSS